MYVSDQLLITVCRGGFDQTYSLAERTALANGDLVTLLDTESGRNVGGNVLVSLLVTGVLGDEVKVFPADDDGSVHLGGNDGTGQDTATDRDETSEGALLVCRVKMLVTRSNMHVLCVAQFLLAQFRVVVSSPFPYLSLFVVVCCSKSKSSKYQICHNVPM